MTASEATAKTPDIPSWEAICVMLTAVEADSERPVGGGIPGFAERDDNVQQDRT